MAMTYTSLIAAKGVSGSIANWVNYSKLDIPTIASVRWAAAQIQFLLFHGKEEMKESLAGGTLLHYQLEVPDHLMGRPIATVESEGRISVVGVERGGAGFLPVKGSTFQRGDLAHFLVTRDAMSELDVLLQPAAE